MVYFRIKYRDDHGVSHKEEGLVDGTTVNEAIGVINQWYKSDDIEQLFTSPVDSIIYKQDMKYIFDTGEDND